ncbi:MAG: hypothetical protein LBS25_07710 [Candidatus Symbiothrix sp.]|jgi:hypothetical protein|nr:hypothetical protein [Candidatus Symbiothrix sp.]
MKKNKSVVLTTIGLIFGLLAQAQGVGSWKTYGAYHYASQVVETPHAVYAVYQSGYPDNNRYASWDQIGSLFSYSTDDLRVQTYSLEDGLNDRSIRFLNYSPEANALLLVYDNNNMDIFLGKHNVYNLSGEMDNGKIINSVDIRGKLAYLSINSGVTIVDLEKKEIRETYNLGANTTATCEWGDYLLASTADGVYRALKNTDSSKLVDKANWEKITLPSVNNRNISKLAVFQDYLIVVDNAGVWAISTNGSAKQLFEGWSRQITVDRNRLIVTAYSRIYIFPNVNQRKTIVVDQNIRSIASSQEGEDVLWVAWGNKGLWKLKTKDVDTSGKMDFEPTISNLKMNSPLINASFNVKFDQNKLLLTAGNRESDRNHVFGTFMVYESGKWMNLNKDTVAPGLRSLDFMSVAVDPTDTHHYFVSSWGEGVYEFRDTTFLHLHSYDNSTLQTINEHYKPDHYVRTDGMAFDRNNNLFVVNVKNGLNVLSAKDKKWYLCRNDQLAAGQINHLIVTRDNKKWLNVYRGTDANPSCIYVFDDQNTADNLQDGIEGTWYSGRLFTDQQGRKVEERAYLCIAEDLTGTVWVGTDNGLIYFTSAEQLDKNECNRIVNVDKYDKGHYPLEGQKITTIAIDGANRKWVGTQGSGIFVVDQSSGDVRFDQFTRSNSSLLSDNINSIAIDNQTGEVFIATDKGLCSYMGEAIDGRPDYSQAQAYPNPVDLRRHNRVAITGLMQNSIVKITDLAGNRIHEAQAFGGQYVWNCTGMNGEWVKAGIYLVFATLSDGSLGVVTKIMIMR